MGLAPGFCYDLFIFESFFFSSRRRHTRLVSDWSSDVCSSDLSMIDHVTVNVDDLQEAKSFYQSALAPLGYSLQMEFEGAIGFGSGEGMPDFWLGARSEERRVGKEGRCRGAPGR